MLQTNQILTSSIRAELYPFQVEKITRQVNDLFKDRIDQYIRL